MKVDLTGLNGAELESVRSQRAAGNPPAAASESPETSAAEDAATLSVASGGVKPLVAKALETPEQRTDRIEALRQAVQNGEYKIDAAKIAEAMIQEANR